MLRSLILTFVLSYLALTATSETSKSYVRFGDHVCETELATIVVPERSLVSTWQDATDKFLLQVRLCDPDILPEGVPIWEECDQSDSIAIRTQSKIGKRDQTWRPNSETWVFNSRDALESIFLNDEGHFFYSGLGFLEQDNEEAWFMMHGQCNRFEE